MTLEEYRMTVANANTQPGATGPDQATRHSAEHAGSYPHRPTPHLEPAPIVSQDHLERLAVDLEKAAKEAAEREAEIDRRLAAVRGDGQAVAGAEPEASAE
jgi:hypothetical protein